MVQNILWKVTILFIYQRMGDRGGLFRAKRRQPEVKNIIPSIHSVVSPVAFLKDKKQQPPPNHATISPHR